MSAVEAPEGGGSRLRIDAFPGRRPVDVDLTKAAPFGWWPAIALGMVALVDRADAAVIGGVLKDLQDQFGFSDTTAGWLLSAPSIAALVLVIPAGRAADTRNRKLLIAAVMTVWGFLTFGAAAAPTFALFFLARILLGIATPLTIPASASLAGDLYMSAARTKAFAILRVMEYLGFPLGVLIGGVASQIWGWRAAFLIMGVPALLMAAVIAAFFREPRRGLADELAVAAGREVDEPQSPLTPVDAEDSPVMDLGTSDANRASIRESIKAVLSIRTVRAVIIGQALLFAGFTGLFAWTTIFFQRLHGLEAGPASAITGGVGLMGLLCGGAVASRIGNLRAGRTNGWLVIVSGSSLLLSAVCVAGFTLISVLPVQIAFYFFVNAFNIIALANIGAATANVLPAESRGTGFAIAQFLITIVGATGALFVGVTSDFVITQIGEGVTDAAQATGLRFGISALIVPLTVGALLILRARSSYESDAARVLEEAGDSAPSA